MIAFYAMKSALLALLAGLAQGQHPGPVLDNHPRLRTFECTRAGGCIPNDLFVVLDSLNHPVYQINNTGVSCGEWGEPADPVACPDVESCQKNCRMDGINDYSQYGVETEESALDLYQLVNGELMEPRVYLLAPDKSGYEMLNVTGGEFTFDVDMSALPCGMNAAVCFMEMAVDGGQSEEPLNEAGAPWGTGYCDAQCFTTPFINGVGNLDGVGSCCNEMDLWEANMRSTMVTPHVCTEPGLFICTNEECEFDGVCDEWGCQFNTYRNGDKTFYGAGPEFKINTLKPFTVLTQFPTNDAGVMTEIRRLFIQDGKAIHPPAANLTGVPSINYHTDEFCEAVDTNRFVELGGIQAMGEAIARGVVAVFSVWWNPDDYMQWLDSGDSGPCNATEGSPETIIRTEPNPMVRYSNICWGEIDATYQLKGSSHP